MWLNPTLDSDARKRTSHAWTRVSATRWVRKKYKNVNP